MGKHSVEYVSGGSASDAFVSGGVLSDESVVTAPIPVVAPTQVTHPWRAVARTAFQMAPAIATLVPIALVSFGVPVAAGVGAAVVAVCLGLTKFMARPETNAFIDKWVPWLRAE